MIPQKLKSSFPESVQPGLPALGLLPDGWQRSPLGERVTEIQRPLKLHDGIKYDLVTVKRNRGGAIKRETLCGKEIKVKSQYKVHANDFLISKRQIVHGACALVPDELDGAIVSNEYAVLHTKNNLDTNFLKYLSETIYFQQTCFHSSIGVHVEKMVFKLDRWFKWEFNFPPFPEQQKIAHILSTWDAAIDCTQKLLENSRQQKKALMQQLLTGKKRLPGFDGECKYSKLSELATVKKGEQLNKSSLNSCGEYEAWNGGVSPSGFTNKWNTEGNTITISEGGNSCGYVGFTRSKFWCGGHCYKLQSFSDNTIFLFYCLKHQERQIMSLRVGSGLPNIQQPTLKSFLLPIPLNPKEQAAIAKVLSTADAVTAQYEAKLANLKTQKRGLMQQLLTGKRRVKIDEPMEIAAP